MEQRLRDVFVLVSTDTNGKETPDTILFFTVETAQSVCDSANRNAKEGKVFRVVEFRRVEPAVAPREESVTLTAPEGMIGAIGTSVEGEDPGSESAP